MQVTAGPAKSSAGPRALRPNAISLFYLINKGSIDAVHLTGGVDPQFSSIWDQYCDTKCALNSTHVHLRKERDSYA